MPLPRFSRPAACSDCSLNDKAFGYAPPSGPANSDLLFVGEALGIQEALQGVPFVGAAGGMLERLLKRSQIHRDNIRVANVVSCQPPGDWLDGAPWEYSAINKCRQYLDPVLAEPHKVIVTLGSIPLRQILDLWGVEGVRVQDFHGTVHRLAPAGNGSGTVRWVVPTYHPSFLQRGAINLLDVVRSDIAVASRILREGGWHPRPVSLLLDPTPPQFARWSEEYLQRLAQDPEGIWLSVDIETKDKEGGRDEGELTADDNSTTILRVNLSYEYDQGLTVPYEGPYIPILRQILDAAGIIQMWNKGYDEPRLRMAGHARIGREIWDLMWGAHHLQSDLPLGLGFWAPFYCLAAGTRVQLWDGKTRKISDLVTKHEQVDLLGSDEYGRPVPLKIKNWFRAESPDQKWVAVHVENGKQPIYCTPEHKIWAGNHWELAGKLTTLANVPIPRPGHNSLIHGTLLGDGSIDKSGYLVFGHCADQERWLRAKAAVFHTGVTVKPTIAGEGAYKPGSPGWRCGVRNVGAAWHRLFYTDRKKQFIPPPDMQAVAVWYGDDGCLAKVGSTYNPRFYIAGFTNREDCVRWFELKYGVPNVSVYAKGTHAECVALIGKGAGAFFREIAHVLHPSMERKLPPIWRGFYDGWMDQAHFQTGRVLKVVPWEPKPWHRRRNVRYCVEVDHPTHRYFTSGGLVSNSDYGAWKHLGKAKGQEALYAAVDSLQTTRVGHGIVKDLVDAGMWGAFYRHTHLREQYVLRPAHDLGLLVDVPRLDAFHDKLQTHAAGKLKTIGESSIAGNLYPKAGYTKRPVGDPPKGILGKHREKGDLAKAEYIAEAIKLVEREIDVHGKACRTCGKTSGIGPKHNCLRVNRRKGQGGSDVSEVDHSGGLLAVPAATPDIYDSVGRAVRYFWQLPFNPDASQQILRFIKDSGEAPGKAKKTRKETANKETLRKLAKKTGNPIYTTILDYKAIKKVDSTYALGAKKRIWTDDRLHPQFTFRPSTLRDSCVNPNIQNVVSDRGGAESLAAGFRECIVASPGCRLLEVDYSGIEGVETGWLSGDPDAIRLAYLGIHAYLASHLIGKPASLSWSDDDLARYFKQVKKEHPAIYDKAKRCVHGNNYGLTVHGMVENFPEEFRDIGEAKATQDLYYDLVPKLPAFHARVRDKAYEFGRLGGPPSDDYYQLTQSGQHHPYAYRHWFWGVQSYRPVNEAEYRKSHAWGKKRGTLRANGIPSGFVIMNSRPFKVQLGEDSKRVIAFYPQSIAAGRLKEAELELFHPDSPDYLGDMYYGRTPFRAPIHDSLLLEVPDSVWDYVVETVVSVMRRPELRQPCPPEWGIGSHLRIGVAAKAGRDWMHMEDLTLPEAVPETAQETMYLPVEETEYSDFQDLQTTIS